MTRKKKILALHGKGSCSDITKIQLSSLGITNDGYDVFFLDAVYDVNKPGFGLDGLNIESYKSWIIYEELDNSLLNSIEYTLRFIHENNGFDIAYGFSQGGVIVSIINELYLNNKLQEMLVSKFGDSIKQILPNKPLFKIILATCIASELKLEDLISKNYLLPKNTDDNFVFLSLIGRKDKFKSWAEKFSNRYSNTRIIYTPFGHEINNEVSNDLTVRLHEKLECKPVIEIPYSNWKKTNTLSERKMSSEYQLVQVKLKLDNYPKTIKEVLSSYPSEYPLLRNARETDPSLFTSYGEMSKFCEKNGEGDLRRIGAKTGDVIAYVAPPGGGALSAGAFIAISSQSTAVPLSATMSEKDALIALEQFSINHLILFQGVSAFGIESAFKKYIQNHPASLHEACSIGNSKPGIFRFKNIIEHFESLPEINHSAHSESLLLRTSGTTSIPKIVPLTQVDLVENAIVLANSIGIDHNDITYSVMPLDHIGGISASILCSMVSGASITCDATYNPELMVDALSKSNPRPTWYSAVPTIHNSTIKYLINNQDQYLNDSNVWNDHNLRFIRSGAAALSEPDRLLLHSIMGCPVIVTYSMSEQMPISQPPFENGEWLVKPDSVGVPVTVSLVIVDPTTLQPLAYGEEGEIAISGETVFKGYKHNDEANDSAHFYMQLLSNNEHEKWFLTGDIGVIDKDGCLTLKGRIKELIKKGGEQVAPIEIETILTEHPAVELVVCFSVPSDLYGEEVGCALILKESFLKENSQQEIIIEMRGTLVDSGITQHKIPTCWKLVIDEDIPRTNTKKIVRSKIASNLTVKPGVSATANFLSKYKHLENNANDKKDVSNLKKSLTTDVIVHHKKVDWDTLSGLRFLLACYVMFMHIGSNDSWGAVSNLRLIPWHVHTFFTLAGFSLAIVMPSLIKNKFNFTLTKIIGFYPLYALAVLLALGNLLTTCTPSTFSTTFHWAQLVESKQYFCEGTPLIQSSWLGNVLSTLVIYLTGVQATPLWGASWFVGFYLWFISMYMQCLIVFPFIYNALYKNRGNIKRLLFFTLVGLITNLVIVLTFWFGFAKDATGYGFIDQITGSLISPSQERMELAGRDNAVILGFYLFSPFWMVYFILGVSGAFLYDAIHSKYVFKANFFGVIADTITVILIAISVLYIAQGYNSLSDHASILSIEKNILRPDGANLPTDPSAVNRIWDNISGRLLAPLTLIWILALTTGEGITARILKSYVISRVLGPTAFGCFLFHQIIGQWYFATTRNSGLWNWWSYQKGYYWFSPQPVPVEWYEYFYIVGLVVLFSKMILPVDLIIRNSFIKTVKYCKFILSPIENGETNKKNNLKDIAHIEKTVIENIYKITGLEAKPQWSLNDCGVASLGLIQLVSQLNNNFSNEEVEIKLKIADVSELKSVNDLISLISTSIILKVNVNNNQSVEA